MALMLRTVGIPSRNVTGFVGGTWNRFGRYYAVREGDAHSWVEAYIDDPGRSDVADVRPDAPRRRAAARASRGRLLLPARLRRGALPALGHVRRRLRPAEAGSHLRRAESPLRANALEGRCRPRPARRADARPRRGRRRAPSRSARVRRLEAAARPSLRRRRRRQASGRTATRRRGRSLSRPRERPAAPGHQPRALGPAAAARRGAQVAKPPSRRRGALADACLSGDALRRSGAHRGDAARLRTTRPRHPLRQSGRTRVCDADPSWRSLARTARPLPGVRGIVAPTRRAAVARPPSMPATTPFDRG